MKKLTNCLFSSIIILSIISCGSDNGEDEIERIETHPHTTLKESEEEIITNKDTDEALDKKALDFDQLKVRYDGKTFKNCEDLFIFLDEYVNVVITIIDKAKDQKVFAELEELNLFMGQFNNQIENLASQCPERFQEFNVSVDKKMIESNQKLQRLYADEATDNADKSTEPVVYGNNKVEVYYFHGSRRCPACNRAEEAVKDIIFQVYGNNDDVQFFSINAEQTQNQEIVQKYNISMITVLIVCGERSTNITTSAFMNASNPDVLKAEITDIIDNCL